MNVSYIIEHFPHFKRIKNVYSKTMGVAMVNVNSGTLVLNNAKFNKLPFYHQFFVLCHEEGHFVLQTKDELEADNYAFKKYEKYNFPNKEAFASLHNYLDTKNPVHKGRMWLQYQRSLENDYREFRIEASKRKNYDTSLKKIRKKIHNASKK